MHEKRDGAHHMHPAILSVVPSRRFGSGVLEALLVVTLLFALTHAHFVLLLGPWPEVVQDERYLAGMRAIWIPFYILLGMLIVGHWRQIVTLASSTPSLALLILACPLSALWSIAPADSLRHGLLLVAAAGMGWYLAWRFDHRQLLELVSWTLSLAIAFSIAAALLAPEAGLMQMTHAGAWRGLFAHKNALGHYAALNLLVLSLLLLDGARPPTLLTLLLICAGIALIFSQSLTAMGAVLVAFSCWLLVFGVRTSTNLAILALLVCTLCVTVFLSLPQLADEALSMIGRDRTLTGRTQLWQETWNMIGNRPLLGYGYNAFWEQRAGLAGNVDHSIGWSPASAHSAYLDLALQLGTLGLILFAGTMLRAFVGFVRWLSLAQPIQIYWTAGFLVFMLAENFLESQLLRRNELTTVLFVATIAMIGRRSSSSTG